MVVIFFILLLSNGISQLASACGEIVSMQEEQISSVLSHPEQNHYNSQNKKLIIWSHGSADKVSPEKYNNASLPPVIRRLHQDNWNIITIRRDYRESNLIESVRKFQSSFDKINIKNCEKITLAGSSLGAYINMYFYLTDAKINKILLVAPNAYSVSDAYAKLSNPSWALDESFKVITVRMQRKIIEKFSNCTKFLVIFFNNDDVIWKNAEELFRKYLPSSECVSYLHDQEIKGHSGFYTTDFLSRYEIIKSFLE